MNTSALTIGLIGEPVAHSYSPRFQQAALDALYIPARYELWHTPAEALAARVAALRAPGCLGANVTIPHKEAVVSLLDSVDALAARIGAVNTIVRRGEELHGYNTDAPGLLAALAEQGIGERLANGELSLQGYTAVLLGAGGAARGAAFALVQARVTRLILLNRRLERAQRLAADAQQGGQTQIFTLSDPNLLVPHPASILINATSVGLHTASSGSEARESPLPPEVLARFAPDTLVFDMIYNPIETYLLCQARTLGLRASNGLPMLLHQGALAFSLWTGQSAPLEVMRVALMH